MTIAALGPGSTSRSTSSAQVQDTSWRELRDGLRVARRDGRHLGSIEHGRRWVALDADGEPIGAYRSLHEAQAAVEDPASARSAADRSQPATASPAVAPGLAAVCLAAAAVLSAAGSFWSVLAS